MATTFKRHALVGELPECVLSGGRMFDRLEGLMLLGVVLCGVAVVRFNAVFGVAAGWVAGSCTAAAILAFWNVLPLLSRRSDDAAG